MGSPGVPGAVEMWVKKKPRPGYSSGNALAVRSLYLTQQRSS